jgi:hypothetical protein
MLWLRRISHRANAAMCQLPWQHINGTSEDHACSILNNYFPVPQCAWGGALLLLC